MSTDALAGRPDRARFRVIVPLPAPRPAFEPSPSRPTLDIVIPVQAPHAPGEVLFRVVDGGRHHRVRPHPAGKL